MKNNILIITFLALPFFALAQRNPGNFRLGFTTSPTIGWMNFNDNNGTYKKDGSAVSSSYGVLADIGFTENYFFGTGFTLTTMAADVNIALPEGPQSVKYKIQYVDIPLTLKLKSGEPGSSIRGYGQFGPDLGIKVSTKHELSTASIPDNANLIRLGLLVGGGAEWKIRSSTVLTGLSFNNPFTRVFDDPQAKNYIVTLNLGVFF